MIHPQVGEAQILFHQPFHPIILGIKSGEMIVIVIQVPISNNNNLEVVKKRESQFLINDPLIIGITAITVLLPIREVIITTIQGVVVQQHYQLINLHHMWAIQHLNILKKMEHNDVITCKILFLLKILGIVITRVLPLVVYLELQRPVILKKVKLNDFLFDLLILVITLITCNSLNYYAVFDWNKTEYI